MRFYRHFAQRIFQNVCLEIKEIWGKPRFYAGLRGCERNMNYSHNTAYTKCSTIY